MKFFILAFWLLPQLAGAESLIERGTRERQRGKFESSVLSFQSLLKIEPDNGRAWYELGISYATDSQYDKAIDTYRLALSHGFTEGQCHCALSRALRESHKIQNALIESRRCLELLPQYAGAWNLVGNIQTDLGHFSKALEAYQKAVALRPLYANAHFNLGLTLDALKRPAEAEASLREAIRLQPEMPQAWTALGDSQLRALKAREAIQSYTRALRMNPSDAEAEWGLARAWSKAGSREKAEAHERIYKRLITDSDNHGYFSKSNKDRRSTAREMEAWNKEARDGN